MLRPYFRPLAVAAICCATMQSASAASYYVSTGGDDSAAGSADAPWATLSRAALGPGPGDTLFIRGTFRSQLILRQSGRPGSPICYMSWPGDSGVLDGQGSGLSYNRANRFGMVQIDHASHLVVSGLRIRNSPFFGIGMRVAHCVRIEHNDIYNTFFSGIIAWEESDSADPSAKEGHSNITIVHNEVELACNDGPQECISLWGTDTFEVAWNHVHHGGPGTSGGEGIDVKCGSRHGSIHHNHVHHTTPQGIYLDAGTMPTYDIDVYCNVVHDCLNQDGLSVGSEGGGPLSDVRIYNNLVYHNGCNGFRFASWGGGLLRDIQLFNNTFVDNGRDRWGLRGGISVESNNVEGIVIRNNICSANEQFTIYVNPVSAAGVTIDHNLIDGFRGHANETRGSDYVEGDPLFVDTAQMNYRLDVGSPAIDRGASTMAPELDLDGIPRPVGVSVDIGAYEYQPSAVLQTNRPARVGRVPFTCRLGLGRGGVRVTENGANSRTFDLRGSVIDPQRSVYDIGFARCTGCCLRPADRKDAR